MTPPDALAGKRILVAEDNAFARDALCELLAAHGTEVAAAEDGEAAVQLFARSGEGIYDAVRLDLDMPGKGGCAAARAIRRMRRRDAGRVLIFALSAAPPQYAAREAEDSGMDACLPKPLHMQELARVLARAEGCPGMGGTA